MSVIIVIRFTNTIYLYKIPLQLSSSMIKLIINEHLDENVVGAIE